MKWVCCPHLCLVQPGMGTLSAPGQTLASSQCEAWVALAMAPPTAILPFCHPTSIKSRKKTTATTTLKTNNGKKKLPTNCPAQRILQFFVQTLRQKRKPHLSRNLFSALGNKNWLGWWKLFSIWTYTKVWLGKNVFYVVHLKGYFALTTNESQDGKCQSIVYLWVIVRVQNSKFIVTCSV